MCDDYEERWQKRRDEQRKFEADTAYEVWRCGGNPDAINPDRLNDMYWRHGDADEAASTFLREVRERRQRQQEQIQEQEQEWPDDGQ